MTGSHILLHFNGDRLAAARTLAWEGRCPPAPESCLKNPGGRRAYSTFWRCRGWDEVDEEEWAIGMDAWIPWKAEDRVEGRAGA
jgi:hypothetical protein